MHKAHGQTLYKQRLTHSSQCPEVGSIIPILQMRKLRQRLQSCLSKDTGLARGRRDANLESRGLHPTVRHLALPRQHASTGSLKSRTPLWPARSVIRSPQAQPLHITPLQGLGKKLCLTLRQGSHLYPTPASPGRGHAGHKQGSLQEQPQAKH